MFDLPWADERFDVVISVNGIWGGCGAALDEVHRVLRPGGLIGISFWGQGPPLDIRAVFMVFAVHAPEQHRDSMRSLNNIAVPGVAEEMLEASGFSVVERSGRISTMEWPDADIAWRALSSVGPAVPALRANDPAVLRDAVRRRTRAVSRSSRRLPHSKRPAVCGGEEEVADRVGDGTDPVHGPWWGDPAVSQPGIL